MSKNHLSEVLKEIEKLAKQDVSSVTVSTKIADLPIDSLDLFTLIGEMEDKTSRSMDDDEMQALNTVEDLVRHFYG